MLSLHTINFAHLGAYCAVGLVLVSCAGSTPGEGSRPLSESTVVVVAGTFDSGTVKSGPGIDAAPLTGPCALSVLPGGSLLVADCKTGYLLRLSPGGVVEQAVRVSSPEGASLIRTPRFMRSDPGGNVYLSDGLDDRIAVYDSRMRPLSDLVPPYGGLSIPPGQLGGMAVDPYGEITVADLSNRCVYRFDAGGRFLSVVSGDESQWARLSRPAALAASESDGSIYVADPGDRRIVVFDNTGSARLSFGETDLRDPAAIALGPRSQVYVADPAQHAIVVFSRSGRLAGHIDAERLGLPGVIRPTDVAVDDSTVYVADPDNGRVLALRFREDETDK
ncbi:MAG: NHL repeat-containing protein [Candidatus Zixiibacteriota bacterium]